MVLDRAKGLGHLATMEAAIRLKRPAYSEVVLLASINRRGRAWRRGAA